MVYKFYANLLAQCYKSNCLVYLIKLQFKREMATKSNTNKVAKPNTKKDNNKKLLAVSSLSQYTFSPRKTRSHIKVQYEKDSSSNSNSTSELPPSKTIKKSVEVESVFQIKKQKQSSSKKSLQKSQTETFDNNATVGVKRKEKLPEETVQESEEVTVKVSKWEPLNWKEILKNLKAMRQSSSAPVDTMGCDKCSDENADDKTKRFQTLVALMLSSQTKDQVTYDAMSRLKDNGLTPENIVKIDTFALEELLKPVSFYKNKAKYLKKTSKILIEKYNSDIPKTIEELQELSGVGPKMAHICMNSAWNIVTGIGVDVHVHRISNRLNWVKKSTKTPEDTRKELESWLPYEHWTEVNHLMVGFGQTICTPINPKCNMCLNINICPFARSNNSKKKK